MRFLQHIREREIEIRDQKLEQAAVVGHVGYYDRLIKFTGWSIEVDGAHHGHSSSYYPVSKRSIAELYFTPSRIHYAFSDDNGFVRVFSVHRNAENYLKMFREGSAKYGILQGEYELQESVLT